MTKIIGGTPFGQGDALVDATNAILMDGVSVVLVQTRGTFGTGQALALNLEGRVNKSTERADHLYLFDTDGAAAIISELIGMAHRMGPEFRDELLSRIDRMPRRE